MPNVLHMHAMIVSLKDDMSDFDRFDPHGFTIGAGSAIGIGAAVAVSAGLRAAQDLSRTIRIASANRTKVRAAIKRSAAQAAARDAQIDLHRARQEALARAPANFSRRVAAD